MLKRPFKSLIARIAIVALALSLVVPFVPAAFAQDASFGYAENGTGPVATFTATDADGDAIVWSLSGADAEDFTIEGGVLAFKSSPNYESPVDEGSDNTYNVTLQASGGSTDVAVTVTNVDEMGSVSLTDLQPQARESVTATVSDEDSNSLDQVRWQWSKSMEEDGSGEAISGATSPTYTPKTDDIDYYLRATATYSDGLGTGRDSASAVTAFAVEARPVANSQPAFADDDAKTTGAQQPRTVRETAKAGDSVGNAVTASDSDNDPLLYDLAGADASLTGGDPADPTVDADDLFAIDKMSGQISVKSGANTDYFDRETYTTGGTTLGADDAELKYTVTVTAEDPSGSMAMVTVTINVAAVDEAADIALADVALGADVTIIRDGDEFVVTTPEQDPLVLTSDPGGSNTFASGLPVFDADDPENADQKGITWSISGPDAKRFEIRKIEANITPAGVDSSAALRWSSDDKDGPSFEDMDSADGDNVYNVTVTVFDGVASKSQAVSVTVNNVEEIGAVSLTQRVPQEGRAVTARLNDPDGGVTGAEWQWYRGGTKATTTTATPQDNDGDIDGIVTITGTIADCTGAENAGDLCTIEGATSSTYTPTEDDEDNLLTVRVTYTDALGDETNSARATSESNAVARPDENAQPTFGDDESVDREVAENDNGANVGEPVTATDSDSGDLLLYTLSGDGSDAFKVNNDGQITTAEELDFETQSSYSVTLTATDPSGASDSITVNITVTDTDDAATISAGSSISYAENGTGPVATFTATDADGDAIVWSLSGADAEDFTIEGGVLAFKSSPNYESPVDEGSDNTYNVTLQASGGSTDVAVTVTNVDEMGSVSLTDLQPQARESVTATVSDEDSNSLDQVRWQWSKSMEEDGSGEAISGATSPTYTPKTDDIDYYLRATATYSDGLGTGRDSASAVTAFAVEARPVANSQPAFADDDAETTGAQQPRTVRETAKAGDSVGNAVTASDSDNDPLLYDLAGADASLTGGDPADPTVDADDLFAIDKMSGQISVKSGANTDYFDRETYTTGGTTLGADDAELKYTVTVTAEDPSGSMAMVTVTINVAAVDEAADIALADVALGADVTIIRDGDEFVVTTPEQDPLVLTSDPGGSNTFASGLPVFDADDPENADQKGITWSISGPDAKRFEIRKIEANITPAGVDSSAALRWSSDDKDGPSFEDMDSADGDNVYNVTVTVFDGVASKSQAVSVTVNNVEEIGAVSLTQRVPQEGRAVTARLNDPDGGVTGAEWQWYRGGTKATTTTATPQDNDGDIDGIVTITGTIADCTGAENAGDLCTIEGATSSTYTPTEDDEDNLLTVRVTYTDALGDETNSARATSESNAVARPDENAQPTFGDDESVDREVAENDNGANVGEPVTATDSDSGDLLLYTLSGDGSDAFKVNNDGQITTAEELDFETQSSYSVTLTATDPSGASDSITVNITVTDTDDAATIQISTENSAPAFVDESVTLSVDENTEAGAPVGDPITATDKDGQDITYSLDDSSVVEIWPSGQFTVAEGANLDYEGDANSYTVVITASDGVDSASIMVTINVNNVGLDSPYDVDDNGSISKDEAVTAVDDYFLDNITREEVNAVLAIYFG